MIARLATRWAEHWEHMETVHVFGARVAWFNRDRRAQYERMALADAAATRARFWRNIATIFTPSSRRR